jgi:hypothetical protein
MISNNFIKLQTAIKKSQTSPAGMCCCFSLLALKTVPSVDDPELQNFHFQQAERMLLSTFIAGLIEKFGQYVRFKLHQTLHKAL